MLTWLLILLSSLLIWQGFLLLVIVMVVLVVMLVVFEVLMSCDQVSQAFYLAAAQGCPCILLPPAAVAILPHLGLCCQLGVIGIAHLQNRQRKHRLDQPHHMRSTCPCETQRVLLFRSACCSNKHTGQLYARLAPTNRSVTPTRRPGTGADLVIV
jgi:hypothetical protein